MKPAKLLKRYSTHCLFVLISFASFTLPENAKAENFSNHNSFPAAQTNSIKQGDYRIKIIAGNEGTFGYDIYKGVKLFIHQPSIPALPGNRGFATKAAAEKVAGKVLEKLRKGESLPTVTVNELKQWGLQPKQ